MNLSLSPIGDFLCVSGEGILSFWGRDNEVFNSFSNLIYYSREKTKTIMAA